MPVRPDRAGRSAGNRWAVAATASRATWIAASAAVAVLTSGVTSTGWAARLPVSPSAPESLPPEQPATAESPTRTPAPAPRPSTRRRENAAGRGTSGTSLTGAILGADQPGSWLRVERALLGSVI